MSRERPELSGTLTRSLESAGWERFHCAHCGTELWACEPANPCRKCSTRARNGPPCEEGSWRLTWELLRTFFNDLGYGATSTARIMRSRTRSTLFVGAGLQIFEDVIYDSLPPPKGRLFVHQPVVRLNYLGYSARAGYSTSFVNLCTEKSGSSPVAHAAQLMGWLQALRATSIRKLELVFEENRWRGGPFEGAQLTIRAAGAPIGDGIFIDTGPKNAQSLLPISDFSFGLERISAARYEGGDFWPCLMPSSAAGIAYRQSLDALRTAALLVLCNVAPSARRHGRELRRLYKIAALLPRSVDVCACINSFANYWSEFLPAAELRMNCESVVEAVSSGVDRARSLTVHNSRTSGN